LYGDMRKLAADTLWKKRRIKLRVCLHLTNGAETLRQISDNDLGEELGVH
jgi:hypothetical protein